MEEMREAAMAYYANMSKDQKQWVKQSYQSLDTNGDGKVSIQEFLDFLRSRGYSQYVPPNLFQLLDKNNDGALDFEECITFCYMIISKRLVICDVCRSYLMGIYFLCVECYNSSNRTFDLCCSCYRTNYFDHVHSNFLDNYSLLREKPWKNDTSGLVASRIEQVSSTHEEKIQEVVDNFELGFQIGTIGIQTAAAAGFTIM